MTANRKFLLAYCIDNQLIAQQISKDLENVDIELHHISSEQTDENDSLTQIIKGHYLPTILLISDNFLRSTDCMYQTIDLLQTPEIVDRLQVIVIDGRYKNKLTNQIQSIPTTFHTVGNVIKYMNFWQDEYLELRKKKKEIPESEMASFEDKLAIVKNVSSNIGEFLRLLRESNYHSLEDIQENDYELFFKNTGNEDIHIVNKTAETTPFQAPAAISLGESIVDNPTLVEENITDSIISESLGSSPSNIEELVEEMNTPEVEIPTLEESSEIHISPEDNAVIDELIAVDNASDILAESPAEEEIMSDESTVIDEIETKENSILNPDAAIGAGILSALGFQLNGKTKEDFVKSNESDEPVVEIESEPELEVPSVDKPVVEIESESEPAIPSVVEPTSLLEKSISESELRDIPGMHYLEDLTPVESSLEETIETEDADADAEPVFEIIQSTINQEVTPSIENENIIEEDNLVNEILKENEDLAPVKNIIDELMEENEEEEDEAALIPPPTETNKPIERVIRYVTNKEEVSSTPSESENSALENTPSPEQLQLLEAKKYLNAGNYDEAVATYESILINDPDHQEARLLLSTALVNNVRNFEKATQHLEYILQDNEQNADAYYLLAKVAEIHKDFILAKSYYEKVLQLEEGYPKVNYRLGIIMANHFTEQRKTAANYFKAAIKNNPRHVDARYQYGIILNEHLGKYSKAIKQFKKTLKLNPLHPFAAYDLALLYHKVHETGIAKKYYQKACKNNPELKTTQNDAVFLNIPDYSDLPSLSNLNKEMESRQQANRYVNEVFPEEQKTVEKEEVVPINKVDKVVMITGATSGIGKATAEVFAENGYRLIITGRRKERLEDLKDQFEELHQNDVHILPFDVRSPSNVKVVINSLPEEWQNIDILINNAGLAKGFAPIHEGDIDHWEQMIDTNIKGLLYITRAVTPHMVERKSGHVINVCSTAGKEVYPNGNVYCATKFAVDALTKSMRLDLYKHNIRVSQVSPAHVETTEFAKVRFDGDAKRASIYDDFNPLTSRDVAETIYFITTRPAHVNIQDVLLMGTQQANSTNVNRVGRLYDEEE